MELVEAATLRAAASGTDRGAWGLVLRVFWAGDEGPAILDRLVAADPTLGRTKLARRIAEDLVTWGHIEL